MGAGKGLTRGTIPHIFLRYRIIFLTCQNLVVSPRISKVNDQLPLYCKMPPTEFILAMSQNMKL